METLRPFSLSNHIIFSKGNVLFLSRSLGPRVGDVISLEGIDYRSVRVMGKCYASILPGVCWAHITCWRFVRSQKLSL